MSKRDEFRTVQTALGVSPTGIPNDESKEAWQALWEASLAEFRAGQGAAPVADVPRSSGATPFVVNENHWLNGAKREPIIGGQVYAPKAVVLHFTAGASGQSSIDYWKAKHDGVCAHLVVERDGAVIQCRPFKLTCGHAGVSRWTDPKTGMHYVGMNQHSIGIEIANAGDSDVQWAIRQPGYKAIRARHRNGGPETTWEAYPGVQVAAVTALCRALVDTYDLHDITGHDCIAKERKRDPGPAFPIQLVREACGFAGLPKVFEP